MEIAGRAVVGIRGDHATEAGQVSGEADSFALAAEQRGDVRVLLMEDPLDAVWLARRLTEQRLENEHASAYGSGAAIAVTSGRTILRAGSLVGRAVEECFELLSKAHEGQTLASRSIADVAGAGAEFESVRCGLLDEYGELTWVSEPTLRGEIPLSLERIERSSPFCGRDPDLRALERAWEATGRSQDRRFALLAGEPGAGKTRLLARLASEVASKGAVVRYVRCPETAHDPLRPIVDALSSDNSSLLNPGSSPKPIPPPGSGDILGDLNRAVRAGLDLHARIVERIAQLGADGPMVLFIDDFHWADPELARLLVAVADSEEPIAGLIVIAFRESDIDETSEIARDIQRLRRLPGTMSSHLGGLDQKGLASLASALTGSEALSENGDLAQEILADTGGNPLFATELLKSLDEEGRLTGPSPTAELSGLALPPTIGVTIRQRVDRLGDDVCEALELAAICGPEIDLELLETSLGWKPERLISSLSDAEKAGLLEDLGGGALGFSHHVVARALAERAGVAKRAKTHRRVAEALEHLPGERREDKLDALARHWLAASPPDRAKALEFSHAAGRRALSEHRIQAAREFYEAALRVHGTRANRLRGELLLGLGLAKRQNANPEFREDLLEAARIAGRLDDWQVLRASVLGNHRDFDNATVLIDSERMTTLESAIDATPVDHPSYPLLLATLAAELSFTVSKRRFDLSARAVNAARSLAQPDTLAYVLVARFITIWTPDSLEERLETAAESVALADRVDDPLLEFRAVHWYSVALIESGNIALGTEMIERESKLAKRFGQPVHDWIALYDQANLAIIHDRLDEADALAAEAFRLATENSHADALPFYGSQLGNIRYQQGRLGELQGLLAQLVADNPGIPAFRSVLALAFLESDLLEQAQAILDEEASKGFPIPQDLTWLTAHVNYAHVAAELGDRDAAAKLRERLEPFAGQIVYTGSSHWGNVDHALGRLGDTLSNPEANELLERACNRYAEMDAPVWLARGHLDTARIALGSGEAEDRDRARRLLDLAITAAEHHGSATVARRAIALRENMRAHDVYPVTASSQKPERTNAVEASAALEPSLLKREGDMWRIEHGGRVSQIKDSIGMRYLATLMAYPGVEFSAAELQRGHEPASAAGTHQESGLTVRSTGGARQDPVLDGEAKRAYRARIEDLRTEINEAESFNDPERAVQAKNEMAVVAKELGSALGLGGRDRSLASDRERARVNVTRAIRRTTTQLKGADSALGAELDRSIRTGSSCSFDPLEGQHSWDVEQG